VGLPTVVISESETREIAHGRFLDRSASDDCPGNASPVVALDQTGNMLAVLKYNSDRRLYPYINFVGRG
jgi:hypothetical protein